MSNEDRIKTWREQRRAGILPTDPQATARAAAFARTAALVGRGPTVSVRAIIKVALDTLPPFAPIERRELYERMSEGVKAGAGDHGLSAAEADLWTRRVTTAVRALEVDLQKGVDVFAPGYLPAELADVDAKLRTRHRVQLRRAKVDKLRDERRSATRADVAHDIPIPPEEVADLAHLRHLLSYLHASQRPAVGGSVPRVLTFLPLFYLQLLIIQSDSRIAILWSFVGPTILMVIISSVYVLNGVNFVMGMSVVAFTLTGAVIWVMFRQIVFRSSAAYFAWSRQWINLRAYSPLVMAASSSSVYLMFYLFVFFAMMGLGHLAGVVPMPYHIVGVLGCIVGIAIMAAATGLFFGAIATKWDYFMRFAPAIERALQVVSSVFFVSEQLPAHYRKWVLWDPLAHGFQLLRSAYFSNYKSHDASMVYFLGAIVMSVVVGIISDRLARPNLQPF